MNRSTKGIKGLMTGFILAAMMVVGTGAYGALPAPYTPGWETNDSYVNRQLPANATHPSGFDVECYAIANAANQSVYREISVPFPRCSRRRPDTGRSSTPCCGGGRVPACGAHTVLARPIRSMGQSRPVFCRCRSP